MHALISTIENFLGIRGKATKSGDFAQDIFGEQGYGKRIVNVIFGYHGITVFDAMFCEILLFWHFSSNINEIFQTISNSYF